MDINYDGIIIGLFTFLSIGLFHPIVIKAEYYFGAKKSWWVFPFLGMAAIVGSLTVENNIVSAVLGVVAFSCFWSIIEVFEQEKRVKKGWFPKNPKRKYYYDKE